MSAKENLQEDSGLPLYKTVRNRLVKELTQGTWKPGDMLPTEVQLAGNYGVSIGTIRQAILSLVREGRLTRTAGSGTFVARLDASRSFARFFRFRAASGTGAAPQIRFLGAEIVKDATVPAVTHLGLAEGATILLIRRVLMSEEAPVCLYRSYLPYELVSGLENEDFASDHLYSLIEKRCGLFVVKAEELLRAGLASQDEASILGIQEADPIIHIERTAQTYGGRVLEWRETVGRSDTFYYKISMP